jgi:uncharacterized repeat protein (TIGR03803 family)
MNLPKIVPSFRASLLPLVAILLQSGLPRAQGASAELTLSNLVSFPANQTSTSSLTQGTNGNFYGTTANGGTNGLGAIFMVTPPSGTNAAALTNLVSFTRTNGSSPTGPLFLAADNYFYGMTSSGGNGNNGTIFKMSHTGVLTTLALFNGTNGTKPVGGLVEGPQGYLYGATAEGGGTNNMGEVFAWSQALGVSNLFSFSGTNGSNPQAGLVAGLDGNLYGTTFQGGTDGLGTVFQLTPSNTLTTLVSFSLANGVFPWGLVQAANSNLFGATAYGGPDNLGTIFKLTVSGGFNPSGTLTLLSFPITNGCDFTSPLLVGRDKSLYGTAFQGGSFGKGSVFQVTNTFVLSNSVASSNNFFRGGGGSSSASTLVASFQGANGAFPQAALIQGSNGNFYGTTTSGGANGAGNVFVLLGFPAAIFQQPSSVNFATKGTARFSVVATGSAPFGYQWQFDGTNLSSEVSGATNSQLTIEPEVLADAGSYSVVVTNAYGAVTSSVVTLTVPAPTLTITSPKSGATVTSATLVVNGAASDKYGVTNVLYQLDGGTNWTPATSANSWTNWSATVNLQAGTNVFKAYSVDPLGNHSATQSIVVFFLVQSPLSLTTNGFGTVQRSFTGSTLDVGKNYTVTAKPAVNNLFSNWTGSITTTNNPLTFLMESNMTLTANFVTNSFLYAAGTYNGLFFVNNDVGAQSSGMLKNLTVGKLGAYSGALFIGGSNYSISGAFNVSGNASNQIARAAGLGSLSLVMNLNWETKPPQVTGTVSGKNGGAWTASLLAEEAGSGLGSAEYTLLIPPGTNAPLDSPIGDGYAVITNHNGTATLTGALADGTAFSESVAESESGYLAVYVSPYTNGGLLLGWLALTNGTPVGSLTWIKPASASGLYPGGFTNVVTVQSSIWKDELHIGPSLTPGPLDVSGAFLATPIIFNVAIDYSNNELAVELVVYPGGATNSFSSAITPKTGLLKITFGNGNGKKTTSGTGVILQNNATGGGYFITSTNAGAFTLQQ